MQNIHKKILGVPVVWSSGHRMAAPECLHAATTKHARKCMNDPTFDHLNDQTFVL